MRVNWVCRSQPRQSQRGLVQWVWEGWLLVSVPRPSKDSSQWAHGTRGSSQLCAVYCAVLFVGLCAELSSILLVASSLPMPRCATTCPWTWDLRSLPGCWRRGR